MRGLKRSGKLIAVLLVLLTFLGFSPWVMDNGKVDAATDPTTLWNTSRSWVAQNYALCDITKVDVSGVDVDHFDWTDSTTCDVVLDSDTRKEAVFSLDITRGGTTSAGVKINGTNNTGSSISHTIELDNGTASVTLQPYWGSKTGTLKTFNFSIEGGGQETQYDVTLISGTGYTLSAVGESISPVGNKGSYTFRLDIEDGYKKGSDFAVKVNGVAVQMDSNDQYTISNITSDQEVTVEDVVTSDTVNQFNVTLTETNGVTYTPIDGSESPVDEGNDYRFKVSLATGFIASGSFAVNDNGTAMEADSNDVYTISNINAHHTITVTGVTQLASVKAPTGSTVAAGTFSNYFVYTWKDPAFTENNGDGTTTYWFNPISGSTFYRVQHPNGVTYWDFQSMTAGNVYTVTEADMHMDDSDFNSDTIYHDFYYNYLDLSDMYLNVNERNYLPLNQGDTKTLSVFRNWQAIESFTNAKIAAPDVHYEVVDINGNPSDLVTVTPDSHNSGYATIAASNSGSGMAIVKITYDAMIHKQGYASGYGAGGADSTRFGATWPECTGIIVVTVGQDGSSINMGMTINTDGPMAHAGKVAGDKIDAEHDLLYYFGDDGAEYTFKPVEGSTVSIARCTVGSKDLSFNGFTTDGVTTDDDGNVTVTGLTAGRHIVKVEKGGVANYQVLSARQVTIAAKDAEGNEIDDWQTRWFAPGDTIEFVLHNVNSPQEKLQGCYNNSFTVYYVGEDGNRLEYSMNGTEHGYGQYNFSSLDNSITLKIPVDWMGKKTYSAERGAIAMAGFSGTAAGGHRSKSFGAATGMATGTSGTGVLGKLPDITVNVDSKPYVIKSITTPVTKSIDAGETYTLDLSKVFTDDDEDELTYKVSIDGGEPVAADEAYEYISNTPGTYNLVFTANDGVYDSDDTYKVVLKVGLTNTPPNRKEGVDATVNETIGQDGQYELDLSTIFEDADEDFLSYKVSVDGGEYVEASKNYVYKPDSAGNVKLVFKANDGTTDSTDTYTVKLKVQEGSDPGIYWDSDEDGTGWVGRGTNYCYVKTVSSSGVRTKEFEWTDDVTCDILLTSDTAGDAVFDFTVTNYASTNKRGVLINGNASAGTARTIQVQLVNGEASVTVQPWGGTSPSSYPGVTKTFNFRIAEAPANEPPVLRDGVDAEVDVNVDEGKSYSVDLSEIFRDPDGDDLTYTVSIDRADPVAVEENYSYTPEGTDPVTLVFKANDGKADSTDSYTVNITVAAHEHDWGEVTYTWSDDNSEVTAERVCTRDDSHKESETVAATSAVSQEATCTDPEKTTWTSAKFENEAFEQQTKTEQTKDATGHAWGEVKYTWSADNSEVTAERVCGNDDAHIEHETVTATGEESKAPTCEEKGETTYTGAAFENPAFEAQTRTVEDIDALGHDWDEGEETTAPDCEKAGVMTYTCKRDTSHTRTEAIDAKGHTWNTDPTIDREATCGEEGEQSIHCSVCDAIDTNSIEPIQPKGHDWGDVTYTWSDDNSQVTAKRVCSRDELHTQTETVGATSEVTQTVTCTDPEKTTWTSAKFENEAFEQQTKTEQTKDATGHAWGEWKVTKEATEKAEGEKTRVCGHDASHKEAMSIPKLKPKNDSKNEGQNKVGSAAKRVLVAKGIAKGKKKGKISWNNVKADRYVIYLSPCDYKGKTYKLKKVKTVNGKTFSWTKTKLKKNVWYKFKVVAQKKVNGKYKTISTSKVSHFVSGNVRGKQTNPKSLKLNKTKVSLKKGKSVTIKGSVTKVKKKKALATKHTKKLRYLSSDPKIATVNAKGKVTGKKAGTCTIYVQTINGIWKTCKVTVK